jgi:uncharacterized membrane protein
LRFRAIWEAAPGTDTVAQNNVAVATVAVSGRPRVLLVEGPGTDASAVTQALQARRFLVDRRSAEDLPGALPALLPYAVVLLADVPAYAVTTRQMEALRHWVGDLGRGLVMLGGDESFGLGGWYRTPVEEVLPVRCDIQDHRIFPSLGLVEAVDKSGSMGGLGAAEKLGMAKEAAIQSMEIMSPTDRFGLVAFDAAATWEVPMTDLRDRRPVRDRIARLQPGGGTDIYPALVEAYGALAREQTAQKHIVLLSDGVTQGADFQALIRLGQKRGVSLSAVAFGEDADAASMRQWARWGAGRSYVVTRPEQVPRIFTREAMMASRSFLVEEPFVPRLGAPDPVTEGLLDVLPPLLGFVLTESRPRARVALTAPGPGGVRVPLLATWRYGLGRTAAWTSDVEPRWARHWLGQPVMERLLGQLVEWLAGVAQADVQARASLDGGRLHVEVDALGPDGSFLDGARGTARVLAPDLSVTELPLHQRGPGRYEAEAPAPAPGTWLVAVALEDARGASIGQATAEASRAWSPEYQPGRDGEPLLHDVARLGGGEVLTGPELERIWARSASPRLVPRSLVPWLLAAALLLWVLDAAARRLAWGSGRWDVAPSAAAAPSLASGPRQAAPPLPSRPPTVPAEAPPLPSVTVPDPPPAARDAYVGGLLNARQRARNRAAGGGDPGTGRG